MIDRLPVPVQHALLLLIVALLSWLGTALPVLGLPVLASTLLSSTITFLLAWLTPITRQYGYGTTE